MKKVTHLPKAVTIMLRGMALFMGLCFLNPGTASAQGNVVCPPNIDFEQGDLTNWLTYTGTAQTGGTSAPTFSGGTQTPGPVAGRHVVTNSGMPDDWYGNFPKVPVGGGAFALKLGDSITGGQAERVRYYLHVPPGFNDYSLNYRFAMVLQNPDGHPDDAKPAFQVSAYDSATGAVVPCSEQFYVANSALLSLGFKVSPKSQPFDTTIYLPWTGSALPIVGQGGKTIIIEVTSYDCGYGGHFGYGYFDIVSCGKYKAAVTYCNLDSGIVRFIGTGITQNYNWYTSKWQFIGTGPYIDAPVPSTPDFFYGVLAGGNPACLDTIVTDTVSSFSLNTVPKTPCVQFGNPIQLNTTPVGGLPGSTYSYQWTGPVAASTLSCITCNNPVASPYDTTSYVVTVVDRIGCARRDTVQVYQAPNAGPDRKVCPLGERPAQLKVAGPPNASFHWYEYGTTNPGQYLTCTDCNNPLSAPVVPSYTYTVAYDGCPVHDTITVYHDTTNYIIAPQDLMVQCRPDYRILFSEAKGPNPKLNVACGTNNPITCTTEDTAMVGIPGTPPKNPMNSPFVTTHNFIKYQFIIPKSELLYSGLYSGTINSMALRTLAATIKATAPIDFMFVSLGCTNSEDFPTPTNNNSFFDATTLTTVATISGYTLTPNDWNEIKFDAPYSWDTSKNLIVDFCVGPLNVPDTAAKDIVSMEEGVAIQKYSSSINVCGGNAPVVYRYAQRPTVRFNYCATPDLPFQYTWMPGNNLDDSTVQNPRAYIARSQDYAVYSVGRNGCRLRDSLRIYVPDHKIGVGPQDSFICQGQPAFMYAWGGQAYKWYEYKEGVFSDASGSLSCTDCDRPVATPMQTTTYAVVFSNEVGMGNPENPEFVTGCPDTLFTTLNVWNLPEVRVLNRDTTITIGQSVQLFVRGAQRFTWSPSGSLSDPNAPAPIATPATTTTYVATGFDMNGCAYRDTVKISVNYLTTVLVPSGFTPNGDGVNDIFRIVNPQVQRLMEFRVFNRWGQEIFTTTDINKGWDGTWKGEPQPIGTYQYLIRVGYADRTTEMYRGDVQLIR